MGEADSCLLTDWSRREGFCPGPWDVVTMRHAERHGGWVACLDRHPVGCVMGARYDDTYGFMGFSWFVLSIGAMVTAWLCGRRRCITYRMWPASVWRPYQKGSETMRFGALGLLTARTAGGCQGINAPYDISPACPPNFPPVFESFLPMRFRNLW